VLRLSYTRRDTEKRGFDSQRPMTTHHKESLISNPRNSIEERLTNAQIAIGKELVISYQSSVLTTDNR
jgi:hypothetical protein